MASSMHGATGYMSPQSTGYDVVQAPRFSPEKMQMYQQLRGAIEPGAMSSAQSLSQMAAGGSPEMWAQLEAPAMRQFGALQGNIASRFSGGGGSQGAMSARHSSGFQNTMGAQAQSLAEQLQANRVNMQQSAQDRLMSLYAQLMGEDPYEMALMKKKDKWGKWIGASLPFIGAGVGGTAGFFTGGPAGALTGAKLGGSLGAAGSKAFFD